ncbi:hypothetical protein [Pseudomonas sp. F(2018)]|uniref:hypothetical protein n=1 Tax=Pseudomonas sp. F(2018) TaxID=2502240 RepID=UPI0010F8F73D|nr:hypothetical protein [Pseudomonas sp. F(2018)]
MQRYHDTSTDPLPIRSPYHEQERQRLEELTAEFLAKGGQVQEVGFQMRDKYTFVIAPEKTPIYSHLFVRPEAGPLRAKAQPAPACAPAKPDIEIEQMQDEQSEQLQVVEKDRCSDLTTPQLAARLMVQAKLGASPMAAAEAVGVTEKQARQLARDFRFTFNRQR